MLKLENHLSPIFCGCLLASLPLSFVYPTICRILRNPDTRDHVRGAINGATWAEMKQRKALCKLVDEERKRRKKRGTETTKPHGSRSVFGLQEHVYLYIEFSLLGVAHHFAPQMQVNFIAPRLSHRDKKGSSAFISKYLIAPRLTAFNRAQLY